MLQYCQSVCLVSAIVETVWTLELNVSSGLRYYCVVVGEKLPWTAKLQNLTIFTTHRSEQMLCLLKPSSLCATLAVTTKYRCLQTDNLTDSLSQLGLCIHADMQMVEMAVSNPQVYRCHLFTCFSMDWFLLFYYFAN